MVDHLETSLVEEDLQMAFQQRQPDAGLLYDSDQGRQHTSATYQSRLANAHCQVSMSHVGHCYDNAVRKALLEP